jgi:hypothetical protein
MKSDLLDAQSCIDWTISKLPDFEETLLHWLKNNIEVVVVDTQANATHNIIVAREKEVLPVKFNVEAGAYINTIRSSLDILAYAIAKREMVLFPGEIYFPVAKSADDFNSGKYRGVKFVKQLSCTERSLIELTKPYQGGNDALWALHQFDIMRKHRRLLSVESSPASLHVWGWGLSDVYTPVASGFMPAGNGETVLGLLTKGSKMPRLEFSPHVTFDEPSIMPRCPVTAALNWFADAAREIIALFDQ